MLGASFTLVILLMTALWAVYSFTKKANIVTLGWASGFIITAWCYFFLGTGDFMKMLTITIMATVWAIRLLGHLARRYRKLQEKTHAMPIACANAGVAIGTTCCFLCCSSFKESW